MATYTIRPEAAFSLDTWIETTNADTNYGNDANLFIGDEATDKKRIIIEFPLRQMRPGVTVTTGTQLDLTVLTNPGSTMTNCNLARLWRYDWVPGEATWNVFTEGAGWETAGGDYSATDAMTFNIATSGNISISGSSFEALVQDALDKRASRLLLILYGPAADANECEIASGQSADVTQAPALTVVTTETDLGYPLPGIKHVLSSWIGSKQNPVSQVNYMAVGIGSSPEGDYTERRRLKEEIYRVPIAGSGIDTVNRVASCWGVFRSGEGTGTITEIGLFTGDTTTLIDAMDNVGIVWVGTSWTLTNNTADHLEGSACMSCATAGANTNPIFRFSTLDLSQYNADDFIRLWLRPNTASLLNSLSLQIEDEHGTWTWEGLESGLSDATWTQKTLLISEATTTSNQVAVGRAARIDFIPDADAGLTLLIDHMRIYRDQEEFLCWAPPSGGSFSKALADEKKIALKFSSLRSTNG